MDKIKRDWLTLNLIAFSANVRVNSLIKEFHRPEKVLSLSAGELVRVGGISKRGASEIVSLRGKIDIDQEIDLIQKQGATIIISDESEYPEYLKSIYSPPPVLYVKGNLSQDDFSSIAIVGTRRASLYGRDMAHKFAYQMAGRGFTVVSGLARGIDTCAHQGALRADGGRTIAVLGSGLNVIYPRENAKLAARIVESGAVISEFPMNMQPLTQNFPARNRIISGMSHGVVVVEAARKSGALITASFALQQGREVFSVPGRVDSAMAQGTLELIRDGAKLVRNVDDIMEELPFADCRTSKTVSENYKVALKRLSEEEDKLMRVLDSEPKHLNDIYDAVTMDTGKIAHFLLKLQLKGFAKEIPGKRFVKIV